jgi:N-carbamoylputrescine amidase
MDEAERATLRLAVAQMEVVLGDVAGNTTRALALLADAEEQAADVVVFPELALSGYGIAGMESTASFDVNAAPLATLAAAAGEMAVAIGFAERCGPAAYNSVAILHRGEVRFVHRKLTLPTYDRFDEKGIFTPGDSLCALDLCGCRVAVLTCNDAWHPALAFIAVQDGAEVLLVPANSATPVREDASPDVEAEWEGHWFDILRFLARVLQTCVVYANRVGRESDVVFYGGSAVVAHDGGMVASAPRYRQELLIADVDLASLRESRRRFPLQQDARLDLIRREAARLTAADATTSSASAAGP